MIENNNESFSWKIIIFSPDSQTRIIWDLICMGLIFIEMVTIPFRLSF